MASVTILQVLPVFLCLISVMSLNNDCWSKFGFVTSSGAVQARCFQFVTGCYFLSVSRFVRRSCVVADVYCSQFSGYIFGSVVIFTVVSDACSHFTGVAAGCRVSQVDFFLFVCKWLLICRCVLPFAFTSWCCVVREMLTFVRWYKQLF